jgi:hypothetical protein
MTTRKQEAAVFGVHMIKQLAYGFDRAEEVSDHAAPGSPMIAFYLNSIYDRLAAMFLLDKGKKPTGGLFSRVYPPIGMGNCLDEMFGILARNVGALSLGEAILLLRNRLLVHGDLSDRNLDDIYAGADMLEPETMAQFHEGLHAIREALPRLAVCLCNAAGLDPKDVGLHSAP